MLLLRTISPAVSRSEQKKSMPTPQTATTSFRLLLLRAMCSRHSIQEEMRREEQVREQRWKDNNLCFLLRFRFLLRNRPGNCRRLDSYTGIRAQYDRLGDFFALAVSNLSCWGNAEENEIDPAVED